jgi:hypothetical protein
MLWGDICAYHQNPPSCALGRDRGTQARYDRYLVSLRGECIADVVRRRHLVGRSWAVVPNDFPYAFADGTKHWVLWSLDSEAVDDPGAVLRSLGLRECVWFENTPTNCSVPGLRHLHVFERAGGNRGL